MKKYRRPPTDDRFLAYTKEQLLIEWLEDHYEENPWIDVPESKDVQFVTGDPLVDKWEREIAEGKIPDLDEDMGEKVDSSGAETPPAPAPEEFEDTYASGEQQAAPHRPMFK